MLVFLDSSSNLDGLIADCCLVYSLELLEEVEACLEHSLEEAEEVFSLLIHDVSQKYIAS